jgi:hypothetical protein
VRGGEELLAMRCEGAEKEKGWVEEEYKEAELPLLLLTFSVLVPNKNKIFITIFRLIGTAMVSFSACAAAISSID